MENKNEYMEKIEELEKKVDSLERKLKQQENKIYFDFTNVLVNVLYPVSIYVTYLFFIQIIPNWFVNDYLSIESTAIIVSAIVNTIFFFKMITINSKLMFRSIFKKIYIRS